MLGYITTIIESTVTAYSYPLSSAKYDEQDEKPFENNPCKHCSNNPQNGGSGICHCILGTKTVY